MKRARSSPESHPASLAHGIGLRRGSHARLCPPRHDHFIRSARHRHRCGLHRVQASPPASGVSLVSAPTGRLYSGTTRRAPDCGQLLYAQTSQGAHLAGPAAPLSHSLHANVLFVAESSGALVWPDHPAGHSPRLLQQREGFGRKDRRLCPALQSVPSTLRMDRYGRFHPAKDLSTLFSYFRNATLDECESLHHYVSLATLEALANEDQWQEFLSIDL